MKEQNFKNHSRIVFGWHIFTSLCILALLIGSIVNLCHADKAQLYSASLLCLVSVILIFIFWYTRVFALKAQDRAIRAEENLRHYVLTGKLLDRSLTVQQVVALRFASDEELLELAAKAVKDNLGNKQIKEAVKSWKADHHRA